MLFLNFFTVVQALPSGIATSATNDQGLAIEAQTNLNSGRFQLGYPRILECEAPSTYNVDENEHAADFDSCMSPTVGKNYENARKPCHERTRSNLRSESKLEQGWLSFPRRNYFNIHANEKITLLEAYDTYLSTADFARGLAEIIYSWKGNSRTKPEDRTPGVHMIGPKAVMRLIDGDSSKHFDPALMEFGRSNAFKDKVGIPERAACLEITTPGNKRSLKVAYGADVCLVAHLKCAEYRKINFGEWEMHSK